MLKVMLKTMRPKQWAKNIFIFAPLIFDRKLTNIEAVLATIAGAIIFGRFLAITRLPFIVAEFASALPVSPNVILAFILVIYLVGGCFVDSLGFLVLTIPIFFPLGMELGFDPIWYSIILTMVTTMGAITPPVGVNIYVVKALAPEIKLARIFMSVSFFFAACIVSIVILMLFVTPVCSTLIGRYSTGWPTPCPR